MAKKGIDLQRYKYPLPIHPVDRNALPQLILHNPVSWAYWIWCVYRNSNELKRRIPVEVVEDELGWSHFLVEAEEDMNYLWQNGFFGTGQMSRSEPTWKSRMEKMMASTSNKDGRMALEKITSARRAQRLAFKSERLRLEQVLAEFRKHNTSQQLEDELIEQHRESLRQFKLLQEKQVHAMESDAPFIPQDEDICDNKRSINSREKLELMPVEALFLSFALPVLALTPSEIVTIISKKASYVEIQRFIRVYVAYHHYRSLRWCVRSGVKFGCDLLLYKRGPPFQHAEFSIMVMDSNETHDYTWYSSVARVSAGAKKTLVLCYIDDNGLTQQELLSLWNSGRLVDLLSRYTVSEVIYKRWVPGKNRD